jgi:hypothetical protein
LESPDLSSADFRDGLDFQFHKRPSREYNSNPHEKGSLRKYLHSHWKEFKDGMSSNAIEGELSLKENPIYCPYMLTDDINHGPISKPILDFKIPFMIVLPSLMIILEIHKYNQTIGVMKTTRITKRGYNSG